MTIRIDDSPSIGRVRVTISLIAIAATVPYLTLKAHWLLGGRAGLNDPEFGTGAVMLALNAITAVMELVAVLLALAFVTAWGRKLPSLLVVAPMWVATGLLGQIIVTLPIQLTIVAMTESGVDQRLPEPPIATWVFAIVYSGFAILGISLIAGFTLYARERWSTQQRWAEPLSRYRRVDPLAVSSFSIPIVLAGASTVQLMTVGREEVGHLLGEIIIFAIAATSAMALALGRPQSLPRWYAIAAAFFSSGALTGWGSYALVVLLIPNDLTANTSGTFVPIAIAALKVLAGLAIAAALDRVIRSGSNEKRCGADHRDMSVQF